VPVEFLADDEAAVYGRYTGAPSRAGLERAFFLDDADKELIAKRRGAHNRLGFALQLTTVRWLGTFLADPLDVPAEVVAYLAAQLGVADPSCLQRYTERRTTRFEHVEFMKNSAADRRAGYHYEDSVLQAEFSLTQVPDRPLSGRVFFEDVVRCQLGRRPG
jgi:TnpA family transposase